VPDDEIKDDDVDCERKIVDAAVLALALWSDDFEKRVAGIQKAGNRKVVEMLPALEEILQGDPSAKIQRTARESIDMIRLAGTFPDGVSVDRLEAAHDLATLRSARARNLLAELLAKTDKDAPGNPPNAVAEDVYQKAIVQIDRYQNLVAVFDCVKSGLSSGSILVLMALGLAITFGSMGVINMAHGELMMIGGFTTFFMEQLFVRYLPASLFNWFFVAALPASFLVAALCGWLIEMFVVRHLYGRPLETLLATLGVSLILIQSVQVIFGYSVRVNSPTWLLGNVEVMQDMVVPYNRLFVVVLCACCVLLFYFIMNYTQYGLRMRATTQNREMAAALGVNTRRIDGYTFALGSGLAGIAGYGLSLIGNVAPDMGQNYIVESFLVVVTGGVGELAGTLYAGMGLGLLNKVFEPLVGAVWGQVLVLVAIMLFIQRRPAGLFPPKGRHADV
jgi:urea transport system permease protein